MKKVLVLGATGAMGKYLIPCLAGMGYAVTGVSLEYVKSAFPNVKYIKADFFDASVRSPILAEHYDGIVDFMIYPTSRLSESIPQMAESTDHYIHLSSYRVYDNREIPIRETSPRLIDTAENALLRNSDDYSIYKARGENILCSLPKKNWTAIRPAITYSLMRYQLVTLEAPNNVGRAFSGKAAVLPEQARDVQGTMTWAGDAAKMIAGLLFNEKAMGEIYTVSTSEHHSWGEIAEYYREICNLRTVWIDKEDYIRILEPNPYRLSVRWQLEYDRLFDRIVDNSKVLDATGLEQSGFTKLYDGLAKEIARCPKDYPWSVNTRMDEYLATH